MPTLVAVATEAARHYGQISWLQSVALSGDDLCDPCPLALASTFSRHRTKLSCYSSPSIQIAMVHVNERQTCY